VGDRQVNNKLLGHNERTVMTLVFSMAALTPQAPTRLTPRAGISAGEAGEAVGTWAPP
jgi:hypothetical protein